jgi:hypothetical protein
MANTIIPEYLYQLQPKSVIFSIIIIGIFFYEPPEMSIQWKTFVSFIIFVTSYVSVSWYDHNFGCQKEQLKNIKLIKNDQDIEYLFINLYHLLIIAPLFIYVSMNKDKAYKSAQSFVLVNFALAVLFHSVKSIDKINPISIGHILFGSVGIYYSYLTAKPSWYYNFLMIIGIYSGLKHGIYIMELLS